MRRPAVTNYGYAPDSIAKVKPVVAANIRTSRRLLNLKQSDVADQMTTLGYCWQRATVSEIERGRRNVTVSELVALTFVLNSTVFELLDNRPFKNRGRAND